MIEVKLYWGIRAVRGFSVSGHADCSPRGSDIVCSAVSTLAQTAVLALQSVAGVTPHWSRQEGMLECIIPSDLCQDSSEKAQTVLKTIITGIENIAQHYPQHVTVTTKEV